MYFSGGVAYIIFRAMDKNGDDAIEREEVRTTAEQLGFEEDAIDSFATGDFDQSDKNNDGKLSILEVMNLEEEESHEEIEEMFDAFDKDGNGLVSSEEVMRSMEAVGVIPELRFMAENMGLDMDVIGSLLDLFETFLALGFQEFDTDGDNMLNLAEWTELKNGST